MTFDNNDKDSKFEVGHHVRISKCEIIFTKRYNPICSEDDFVIKKVKSTVRSSRPEVLCEKGVLRNFAKFTGEHMCQGLYFNKVAGRRHKKSL